MPYPKTSRKKKSRSSYKRPYKKHARRSRNFPSSNRSRSSQMDSQATTFSPSSSQSQLNMYIESDGIGTTHSNMRSVNLASQDVLQNYKSAQSNCYTKMVAQPMNIIQNKQGDLQWTTFSYADIASITSSANQGVAANGNLVNTGKYFLESAQAEWCLTNSSNANVELDFYCLKCKRDGGANSNPQNMFYTALRDESAQTVNDYTQYWGTTPFMAPAIFNFWKLLKIVHVSLGPGQSHVHRENYVVNREFDNEIMENAGSIYFKDITHSMFLIGRGMPMSANTNSNVATTASYVDIVLSQNFRWKYISDNDTNYTYTTATSLGNATNVYNQGSGAAVAQVQI